MDFTTYQKHLAHQRLLRQAGSCQFDVEPMTGDRCMDLLLKASNHMWQGGSRKAIALLKEADGIDPGNPQVSCLQGIHCARTGDWTAAQDFANRSHGALVSDLVYLRALIAAHLGNIELANQLVDSVFQNEMRSDEDNAFLASFYLETGQIALSEIAAARVSPHSIDGYSLRLAMLLRQHNSAGIRTLVDEMPANTFAFLVLKSRYCYVLQDFDGSLRTALEAEALCSESTITSQLISCSSYWLRDFDECLRRADALLQRGELDSVTGNLAVFAALRRFRFRMAVRLNAAIDIRDLEKLLERRASRRKVRRRGT